MNFNLTLIIQMLVFAMLIWAVMTFAWPKILGAMDERGAQDRTGPGGRRSGPAVAGAGAHERDEVIREAREHATQIIDQAQRGQRAGRAGQGHRERRRRAPGGGGAEQIELDATRAREGLRREVAGIAVTAASKVLEREIDAHTHADLFDKLADADLEHGRQTTIARPYAHAAFAEARGGGAALCAWSAARAAAAGSAGSARRGAARQSACHPRAARAAGDRHCRAGSRRARANFVRTLAENRRLDYLPQIAALFDTFKDEAEGIADVTVTSATALDETRSSSSSRRR